eukprot:scaffold154590_cov60-Cyclotella_meneghiniana.AAC.2
MSACRPVARFPDLAVDVIYPVPAGADICREIGPLDPQATRRGIFPEVQDTVPRVLLISRDRQKEHPAFADSPPSPHSYLHGGKVNNDKKV